jgi:hypothetical protein
MVDGRWERPPFSGGTAPNSRALSQVRENQKSSSRLMLKLQITDDSVFGFGPGVIKKKQGSKIGPGPIATLSSNRTL